MTGNKICVRQSVTAEPPTYISEAPTYIPDSCLYIGYTQMASVIWVRCLGAAIDANTFTEKYVLDKVDEWVNEIMHLSAIASTQPHAAHAAFTHGLSSPWTYILRTIPHIQNLL